MTAEYALDYFEKFDISYPLRITFTGNPYTSRKIIKNLLKTIDTENLTILSTEDYSEETEDTCIFTRYSPLVQNRIKSQDGRKCVVFDNIVYHRQQILPLFREVETNEEIIFLQSKIVLEENTKFDFVFIVSYNEEGIEKIHSFYKVGIPFKHFCDIVSDCIDQGDCFVLKTDDNSLYYYCED